MSARLMRLAVALPALILFILATEWGGAFRDITSRSWVAFTAGRQLSLDKRRSLLLDNTYTTLKEVIKRTPPDAVILFPPKELFREGVDYIPLTAMASSTYNFIYPRVPVHYGDNAPYRDRVTHVLNYRHWALETFWPQVERTEENRYGVLPWPGGFEIP